MSWISSDGGKGGYASIIPIPLDFSASRREWATRINELVQQELFHRNTEDLARTKMFRGISSTEMESLINSDPNNSDDCSKFHLIVAHRGHVIIEEGTEWEHSFFVLVRGSAVVRHDGEEVAFVEAWDPVWHFAHFAGIPRTATVIATSEDTLFLQFFPEALEAEMSVGFRIYRNLWEELTGQFMDINRHAQKLWNFLEGSVWDRQFDDCYILAKKVVEEIRRNVKKEGL